MNSQSLLISGMKNGYTNCALNSGGNENSAQTMVGEPAASAAA
jgi:hypothetical protein